MPEETQAQMVVQKYDITYENKELINELKKLFDGSNTIIVSDASSPTGAGAIIVTVITSSGLVMISGYTDLMQKLLNYLDEEKYSVVSKCEGGCEVGMCVSIYKPQ